MNELGSNSSAQQVNSIEPILQFCIFCDNIAMASGGKPVFIGVFDSFLRPSPIPQFFIILRWVRGIGKHTSLIKILNPELEPIYTSEETEMDLPHKAHPADARYGFVNFEFPGSGVYWVEIFLNGESYTAIPLPVHEPEKY